MAGLIISQLVPITEEAARTGRTSSIALTKPLLALLGGFSASLVYRILNLLLTSVETMVRGDERELRKTREQLDKARATETENINRLQLLAKLSAVRQSFVTSTDQNVLLAELDRLEQHIALNSPLEMPITDTYAVVRQEGRKEVQLRSEAPFAAGGTADKPTAPATPATSEASATESTAVVSR
jgi:hypothetical protein